MSADDDSFLARWSRRKVDARRSGEPAAESPATSAATAPPAAVPASVQNPAAATAHGALPATALNAQPVPVMSAQADQAEQGEAAAPAHAAPPPLTLDDVAALTRDSDYTRFVAGDVVPDVRNAAMKKLFSDPHFNVMDGLDVYIDDYGKPDPLPAGMLRSLAQSRLLGLFSDVVQAGPAPADPDTTSVIAVPPAFSCADPNAVLPETPDEDPDLRLQPDDAAGCEPGEPGGPQPRVDPAGQP
ncbi:MAG: DUF3306 domain-containing protein [Rubrivivax sp.]|nr:DUF3306 domain-containing protein [Rubrivivax sp.]